ncbi:MAG: terminase [Chloroflexi bacterium]|nr:terminase [Chloroflexota bacterium]
MARKKTVAQKDPHDSIVSWYRRRLSKPAKVPWKGLKWQPAVIGPTWEIENGKWVLPEFTLGWDVLGFCGTWLQHEDGLPWRFTDEQARFVLWWYALDEDGEFLYRDGVFQRLKGWGKDPLAACLLFTEAFGPCRFAGWDGNRPIATDVPNAWVQTAAVSLKQTKNTMRLFPIIITPEATKHFRLQIGKEMIHGLSDTRLIEAVTSSPTTLEGARATLVVRNETHLWTASNEGHEMSAVIERNATKSEGGSARSLAITNAYEPSEDSSAQHDREAWEKINAGMAVPTGLLYDSLEAPPEAPLSAEAAPKVVVAIRGDSVWLSPDRIVKSILDVRNPPSRSRRWWYNQITATEDAWTTQQEWDACADPLVIVSAGDTITMGFDGSFSDDHSALIGCHVETDHLFEIDIWEPLKSTGEVDRAAIDRAVRGAFELYDVVGFYSDLHPFESYVDQWAEDFGEDLIVKSSQRQPIAFDMRSRGKEFTAACERLNASISESAAKKTAGKSGPRLTHDGSSRFRIHVLNARRNPNQWGISVRKVHRESSKKIDALPAAVMARLARGHYLALPESKRRRQKRSGVVW